MEVSSITLGTLIINFNFESVTPQPLGEGDSSPVRSMSTTSMRSLGELRMSPLSVKSAGYKLNELEHIKNKWFKQSELGAFMGRLSEAVVELNRLEREHAYQSINTLITSGIYHNRVSLEVIDDSGYYRVYDEFASYIKGAVVVEHELHTIIDGLELLNKKPSEEVATCLNGAKELLFSVMLRQGEIRASKEALKGYLEIGDTLSLTGERGGSNESLDSL